MFLCGKPEAQAQAYSRAVGRKKYIIELEEALLSTHGHEASSNLALRLYRYLYVHWQARTSTASLLMPFTMAWYAVERI